MIAVATIGGVILCFTSMDPVRELFWSAVVNGVIAVPIMAIMMLLAGRADTMGEHVIGKRLRALGWLATLLMAATVGATVIATVALAPLASAPRLHVTVPAASAHVPCEAVAPTYTRPAGSGSVTVTAVASFGPLLVTPTV